MRNVNFPALELYEKKSTLLLKSFYLMGAEWIIRLNFTFDIECYKGVKVMVSHFGKYLPFHLFDEINTAVVSRC